MIKIDFNLIIVWILLTTIVCLFNCDKNDAPFEAQTVNPPDPPFLWEPLSNASSIYAKSLVLNNKGYLYAASGNGVHRSMNRGETWDKVFFNQTSLIEINPLNDDIFVPHGTSLKISSDDGDTWRSPTNLPELFIMTLIFPENGDIYAGCFETDEIGGGMYISRDNGDTWIKSQSFVQDHHLVEMIITSNKNILVSSATNQIYKSNDLGQSWRKVDNSGIARAIYQFRLDSYGRIFAGTWGDGIHMSENEAENWMYRGLRGHKIRDMVIDKENTIIVVSNDEFSDDNDGVYYSTDFGIEWHRINEKKPILNGLALVIDDEGFIYVSTAYEGIFRSSKPSSVLINQ